ncbi:hypothetical protein BH24CHL4_BH24CHL4_16610 [soil metagenome]
MRNALTHDNEEPDDAKRLRVDIKVAELEASGEAGHAGQYRHVLGALVSFEQRAPIRLPAFDYSESASTHSTSGAPGVSNPASSTTVGSLPWL